MDAATRSNKVSETKVNDFDLMQNQAFSYKITKIKYSMKREKWFLANLISIFCQIK